MQIKTFESGVFANSYTVLSERSALVVDVGNCTNELSDFLNDNCDKERLILLTHAHYDHIAGADELRRKTGTHIAIGAIENDALSDKRINLSSIFGIDVPPFNADILLNDNEKILPGDLEITAIHTPGHTKGGMCYFVKNVLFSGDTIFRCCVGRTDFPGGSTAELRKSLERISCTFDDELKIYPGHGESTSLGYEKRYNPYMQKR